MANRTKNGLPSGVSVVSNRPGLYRLTCMIRGQRFSEYYRPTETTKKKLQSELQKAVDTFRERAERGALKSGDISDKSTWRALNFLTPSYSSTTLSRGSAATS